MLQEFLLLATAHLFAVATPGGDFAVVLKNTLRSGRKIGVLTAIGVGCGIAVHVVYTLFGVAIILSQSETLFNIVKITGACYLLWMAWGAFGSRAQKAGTPKFEILQLKNVQAMRQGFITNVFNPKVTIFFLVLFTSIVSPQTPLVIQGFYGLWLVIYTMIWFMLVAWIFSRPQVLHWYQSHGHYFDWAMGAFLVFIAIQLLL